MRKTLAVVALTASLTGGTAAVATTSAYADTRAVASATESDAGSSDKTGLWGLLGLLAWPASRRRRSTWTTWAAPLTASPHPARPEGRDATTASRPSVVPGVSRC
jgi:MYXO-CTERM domain-containing protein